MTKEVFADIAIFALFCTDVCLFYLFSLVIDLFR